MELVFLTNNWLLDTIQLTIGLSIVLFLIKYFLSGRPKLLQSLKVISLVFLVSGVASLFSSSNKPKFVIQIESPIRNESMTNNSIKDTSPKVTSDSERLFKNKVLIEQNSID